MQGRQVARTLDLTQLNALTHESDSHWLFNVLISHHEHFVDEHEFENEGITLSHPLKRVDPSLGSSYITTTYFEVGHNQGRLYLFALGMCYYQPSLSKLKSKKIDIQSLHADLDQLIKDESGFHKREHSFTTPLREDFNRLREDIAFLNPKDKNTYKIEIASLHQRISFYQQAMSKVKNWKERRVKRNEFQAVTPPALLINFIASTLGVNHFPNYFTYPFQNHCIIFNRPLVKRNRPKKQDQCLDILSVKPMYGDPGNGIYKVIGMFAFQSEKRKPKHPRLYKIASARDLTLEYERTERFAPYLGLRNFQGNLFSEQYCGLDLIDYCSEHVRPLLTNNESLPLFIEKMLKISYAAFKGLAEVMKDEVHGDIKSENLIVMAPDNIKPIDFERTQKFTYLYASPERLRGEPLTPKSDVWSLMRSLINLWGDNHKIWNWNIPTNENNRRIAATILADDRSELLKGIASYLANWVKNEIISEKMSKRLLYLFYIGCEFKPENRFTASEFSNAFKALYDQYLKRDNEISADQQGGFTHKPNMIPGL